MPEGQVNQTGDQGNPATQTNDSLGWRAALPDEYKEHEYVKTFQKPGDFVKSALDLKTERDGLKTERDTLKAESDALKAKTASAIFKPGEKATKEETAAYRKTMDIPDTPDGYEIPKIEGEEGSKEMIAWARETFHKADLSKAQAKFIGEQWNGFITEFNKQIVEQEKKAVGEAMGKLKTDLGADYDKQYELGKRLFKKVMEADFSETDHINLPTMLRFVIKAARLVGEDPIPPGGQQRGNIKEGMIYDKTPGMMPK